MRNKRRNRFLNKLILTGVGVCLIPIGQACYQSVQHRAQRNDLKEMVAETNMEYSVPNIGAANTFNLFVRIGQEMRNKESDREQTGEKAVMLGKYVDLYEENNDLAGWLSIEGMKIDYPVMQGEDNEYYLHHDFYGEDSKYGCLYVKTQADLNTGTNFIIYGHNMKDGSMFGDLDLYLEESFYKEHSTISFGTLYDERAYEIIAVFRSQVYNADDDVFKYYQFYEAQTQEEFDDFYNNIKKLSIYDTGVVARFGDRFLTLSTCAYHVPDGRLVIVAKQISER